MNAAEIAEQLGEARREGKGWRCRCPVHGGAAFHVADGDRGLLVKCWAGCDTGDVLREFRRLGYLSGERPLPPTTEEITARREREERNRRRKIERGLDMLQETVPIADTVADTYLKSRCIDVLSPYLRGGPARVLRFHPNLYHSAGVKRPAIVARIEHVRLGFLGISATYLARDGSCKAAVDPPRRFWGCPSGGAVFLAPPRPGERYIVAEGIETALSCMQSTELAGCAALSCYFMPKLALPAEARHIVIAADNDRRGTGYRLASKAALIFLDQGRRARVAMPERPEHLDKTDFNDVLRGQDA